MIFENKTFHLNTKHFQIGLPKYLQNIYQIVPIICGEIMAVYGGFIHIKYSCLQSLVINSTHFWLNSE